MFGDHTAGYVEAAGVDHVRLAYQYLDHGDADGYESLLDAGAVLEEPGRERVCGRMAVAGARRQLRGRGEHDVHDVFAHEGRVAAIGRFRPLGRDDDAVGFADIYTLSEHGLLVSQRSFYFVHPA
jgi:SnoaL-like domain